MAPLVNVSTTETVLRKNAVASHSLLFDLILNERELKTLNYTLNNQS